MRVQEHAIICYATAPMTAVGQHSTVPPSCVHRAPAAPRARPAHTAREAPSLGHPPETPSPGPGVRRQGGTHIGFHGSMHAPLRGPLDGGLGCIGPLESVRQPPTPGLWQFVGSTTPRRGLAAGKGMAVQHPKGTQRGKWGFKWSGCIVRIRLWLRLPHGCHRLLSIVSASGTSLGVVRLCVFLSPVSTGNRGGGGTAPCATPSTAPVS